MTCKTVNTGGVAAIVCSRGPKKRCKCSKVATRLCDYPLDADGRTCSKGMCDAHALTDGEKDYCPIHATIRQNEEAAGSAWRSGNDGREPGL